MKSNHSSGEEGWANSNDTGNRSDKMNRMVEKDHDHPNKEIIVD